MKSSAAGMQSPNRWQGSYMRLRSVILCTLIFCGLLAGQAQAATPGSIKPQPTTPAAPKASGKKLSGASMSADDAYRSVLSWATGNENSKYLDDLYLKIESASSRYSIPPELALAVIGAEARYGERISWARHDSWQLHDRTTGQTRDSYPKVTDDLLTMLSELRYIMSRSSTMDQAIREYWCGPDNDFNLESYPQFNEAVTKIWNALEIYASQRRSASPAQPQYNYTDQNSSLSWEHISGGGDMKNFHSKLTNMPRNAAELKPYKEEAAYANAIRKLNKNVSGDEALLIARTILNYCDQADVKTVDPRLIMSIVCAESRFNSRARSKVGALGLGQLMPATAKSLGISDPLDPVQNLWGCVKYVEREIHRWADHDDALDRVLASYNAGPGAVKKYNGIPPYDETRHYVRIVKKYYADFTH